MRGYPYDREREAQLKAQRVERVSPEHALGLRALALLREGLRLLDTPTESFETLDAANAELEAQCRQVVREHAELLAEAEAA